jgi:2-(1,2-epoxy-1,2-dihydrophenyl)acetyl-CoA isomerase
VTTDQGSSVLYEVDAAVATLTMTAASLGRAAKESLLAAVLRAAADTGVRAVVLTGSGRVFNVGQDLREHAETLRDNRQSSFATLDEHYNPLVTALSSMAKPVLALVNGSCAGAGLSLALACDLRIAAAGVRMTTAFTNIGLTADSGLSATLSRAVGTARASELLLLAQPFTAEDALGWGLVGQVVPEDELASAGRELALRLAAGPTQAYAAVKRAIRQAWALPLGDVLAAETRAQAVVGATADHRGAVEAFLAKRAPEFSGGA